MVFHVDFERRGLELSNKSVVRGAVVSCVLAIVAKVDITNADSEVEYIASDIWLPIVIHMGMNPPEAEISME